MLVGTEFVTPTVTVKLFVALSAGEPLSVTFVLKGLVLGLCNWLGVQRMMPLASMVAPVGELSSA
jgi:hypothetical protein